MRGWDGTQYWRGQAAPLITVGYLTSTAGSLAAGYAIGWAVGKFSMPHSQRFQFDISAPELGFVDAERKRMAKVPAGERWALGRSSQSGSKRLDAGALARGISARYRTADHSASGNHDSAAGLEKALLRVAQETGRLTQIRPLTPTPRS